MKQNIYFYRYRPRQNYIKIEKTTLEKVLPLDTRQIIGMQILSPQHKEEKIALGGEIMEN